jgi:hypothetical protein
MQQAADLYLEKEKDLYIQTVKGRRFYMSRPEFDIEEIAHATSMQCRYTGHTRDFYSVAEHCVMVSHLCEDLADCQVVSSREKGLFLSQPPLHAAFEGLMHDAHEAYVSDIASPWKALIPDYRKMEERLEAKCREHFGIAGTISEGVKRADWYALFLEARELLPHGVSDDWLTPAEDFRARLQPVIDSRKYGPKCLSPSYARRQFIARFRSIQSSLKPAI